MKTYRVIQTEDAAKAIHDRVHYIIDRYSNDQVATAVWEDYKNTRDSLATTAGSIAEPESRVMTVVPGTSGMIKEAEEHVRAGFRISMAIQH